MYQKEPLIRFDEINALGSFWYLFLKRHVSILPNFRRLATHLVEQKGLTSTRLSPHSSIRPTLQTVFVVTFLPDKDSARAYEHASFSLIEATFYQLENARSDCLEHNLRVTSVSDAKTWMGGPLQVLYWGIKHGQ